MAIASHDDASWLELQDGSEQTMRISMHMLITTTVEQTPMITLLAHIDAGIVVDATEGERLVTSLTCVLT